VQDAGELGIDLGLIKIARTHKASNAQPDKSMCLNIFTVPGSQTVLSASYVSRVNIQTSNREPPHTKLQVAERETKPSRRSRRLIKANSITPHAAPQIENADSRKHPGGSSEKIGTNGISRRWKASGEGTCHRHNGKA
jgi:hypothetical protein